VLKASESVPAVNTIKPRSFVPEIVECGGVSLMILSRRHSRVARAKVLGDVCALSCQAVLAHLVGRGQPLAIVLDYAQASITSGIDDLLRAARRDKARGQAHWAVPVALVRPVLQQSLFDEYCAGSMRLGVLRAAFATEREAITWSACEAEVRAQWLARRQAAQ
jgi:hypothetical protein